MNTLKVLSSIFLCLFFNTIYSQTGPGGVGNTLSNGLWLKADDLTLSNASLVTTWPDASGNNNDANATTGQQPLFSSTSSLNNMPTVRLDGINDQMVINNSPILDGSNGISFFAVIRPNNLNGTAKGILGKRITYSTSAQYAYTWFFYNNNYLNTDINTSNNRFSTSPTSFSNANNYILELAFDGSLPTAERSKIYSADNLIKQSAESSTSIINSSQDLVLGALNLNYGTYLGADFCEMIHYNYALNKAERIIVNNYLSAKYNIALGSNDIYTQDDVGNGDFDHHVAGIGQANDGSNHIDSRGSGIVRISNPTALNDNNFLFWGEETRNPTYNFSTNTSNYTEQLNSRWRVNKQGALGTHTVSFDISGVDLSGKLSCSQLQLVVDNNYDFSSPDNVYNLTIVGTTATATGVIFQNNRYFTLRYTDQIVWDGSSFFNGSEATNGPNTSDACLKLIIKSGTAANLTVNAHVRDVEIEPGATLNVANGILLETDNQVVINGTIDLLGEAQLIQNHTGVNSNSGTGSLKIRQQGTTNLCNYNYWSSPVNRSGNWQIGYLEDATGTINFTGGINANPATTPITLSNSWLYSFYGPSNDYNSWSKLSTTTNLSPGIGFTMKGSGALTPEQEYIFRGIPNDGTYTYPVTANTDFLVGNPYPSSLDANQFILDNLSIIDGSLYFWESFTTSNSHYLADYEGGYSTYNLMMPLAAIADLSGLTSGAGSTSKAVPTQYISVSQGFFTSIISSGTLTFNNSQRAFSRESLGESVYYKSNKNKNKITIDERPKVWFSFTSPKKYSKTIGLGYDTNHATYGYDRGYDAKSYDNLKNDFYWLLDDEPLVIQALPEINVNDALPLGIKISDAGLYEFSINKEENIPDNLNIYLLDKDKNIYYNLKEGEAQLFLNTGNFNQFSIVFKEDSSLETIPFEKNIFVSYNSNTKLLELHTDAPLSNIDSFNIYNTLGQKIMDIKNPSAKSIDLSNLQNSVYFLKVNTESITNSKGIKFVKY